MSRRDLFWRSAMSGGRSTMARRSGADDEASMVSGDLAATHSLGYDFLSVFCVECKHVHDLEWHLAIYRGTGHVVEFWHQAREQTPEGRLPMLLLKEDRRGELVGVDSAGLRLLRLGIRRWTDVPVVVRMPVLHDLNLVRMRDVLMRCDWSVVWARRSEAGRGV